uniref:Predicted protein n=1 Tax=Hordeum vulgare subsp. vulgare TaxID=112509 RepID=F2EGZ5_HORVV|nr:predicted protein [Hordeum vulgare subsp. vulgare]
MACTLHTKASMKQSEMARYLTANTRPVVLPYTSSGEGEGDAGERPAVAPMKTLMTETSVMAVVASTVDAMMLFRSVCTASTPFFSVFCSALRETAGSRVIRIVIAHARGDGEFFRGGGTDGHDDGDPALPGEGVEADDGAGRVAQDGVEEPQVVAGHHRQPQGHQHQIKILLPNHCLDPLSAPSPRHSLCFSFTPRGSLNNLSVSPGLESEGNTFWLGSTQTATKEVTPPDALMVMA